MGIFQAYKMALKSIFSNTIRSILTMLGVIIGVAAVITAVAFAKGSTKQITDRLSALGTELISVSITTRNSSRDITYDDIMEFTAKNSDVISAVAPIINGNVTAKFGISVWDTRIVGTTEGYADIKKRSVSLGRYLSDIDNDYRIKTAVIGTKIVDELFGDLDPLGQYIKLNGTMFMVVGVLDEVDGGLDGGEDDQIIIPVETAKRLIRNAQVRNYSFLSVNAEVVQDAMDRITEYLVEVYKDTRNFRVQNAAQMLDTLDSITSIMMTVMGGIAAISLIVGGIGIMNIMLVSVTERTREIGIRKAVGAKRRNIMAQFLIEALMITGIGGVIGVTLGCGAIWIIGKSGVVPSVYSIEWMVIAFGISILVGVIFGIIPANKAAKMNPIEALRYE